MRLHDCLCWLLENISSSSGAQERKRSWLRIIDIVALLHWCSFRKYPLSEEGGTASLVLHDVFLKSREVLSQGLAEDLGASPWQAALPVPGAVHSAALCFLPWLQPLLNRVGEVLLCWQRSFGGFVPVCVWEQWNVTWQGFLSRDWGCGGAATGCEFISCVPQVAHATDNSPCSVGSQGCTDT